MRPIVLLALLAPLIFATGCGQAKNPNARNWPTEDMSPGDPGDEGGPNRFAQADGSTVIRVFYGTDRAPTGSSEPNRYYGSKRDDVQFGTCDVSIPSTHREGELEKPRNWRFEVRENTAKHVVLLSVQPADGERFLTELKSTIAESEDHEAFVFIHGYNVTFKDAARRTAQIAHDLKFRGAPIMFSWPAQGDLKDYTVDETTAKWAEPHVTEFIEAVALACGAKRIHLIAHSMGNFVLTQALDRMIRQPSFGTIPEFNEIVLTAPDVDAGIFKRDIAPRIVNAADRVTIYASENDRALKASNFVHGFSRLGQAGKHLTVFPEVPKIDVIDASTLDVSLFDTGHSYYGSSPIVLDDIRQILGGKKPGERGLRAGKDGRFWTLIKQTRTAAAEESRTR